MDFALVGLCRKGDLVVTQDYGVAAMILGKGVYGIHQSGKWYTNENIDQMLMERINLKRENIISFCIMVEDYYHNILYKKKRN